MTIAECLYMISVVSKKYTNLTNELAYSYIEPLALNGKALPKTEKAEKMPLAIKEAEVLLNDLLTLKNALQKANTSLVFDGESLGEKLERAKLKRQFLDSLDTALLSGEATTKAESGVGLVTYGLSSHSELKAKRDELEREIHALSLFIDKVNAEMKLEVTLLGNY